MLKGKWPLPKWHTNMELIVGAHQPLYKLKKIVVLAHREIERLDEIINEYRRDSEAGRLRNLGKKQKMVLSPTLFYILQMACKTSQKSKGAFDITVGPLVQLWKRCRSEKRLPREEEIKRVRANIGWHFIKLNQKKSEVTLSNPNIMIELGGISKGYAVDHMVEFLKKEGVEVGLVNIGGEIKTFGKRVWKVGIQNPMVKENEEGEVIAIIQLKDMATATSGHYFRYYEIKGKKYSHIMDPRTCSPVPWRILSATILAKKCIRADAYATALCILSVEQGLKLARENGLEAFIIAQRDGKVQYHMTPGFAKYLVAKVKPIKALKR